MPPTHTPTIHPMSIKDISMFLYRKQIFVILPFHFSWLNWVRKCCSISANFCIVYSCSTFRPSDHAYCQLYQFNSLTFHPFWQFHSMESNRSSSSINSYTFSSIGSITSIIFDWNHLFHNFHALNQPFKSVLHFLFHFSATTKTNSFINSINAIREGPKKTVLFGTLSQTSDPTHPPRAFGTPLSER